MSECIYCEKAVSTSVNVVCVECYDEHHNTEDGDPNESS